MKKIVFFFPMVMLGATMCNDNGTEAPPENNAPATPLINFTLMNVLPHDTSYFTEGLEFYKGQLYESSGGDTDISPFPSGMGVVNMTTGKVDTRIQLDKSRYFGEGITFFNNKLYMLTWKSRVGFVFDPVTFKKIREFSLPSQEGWGLTHDTAHLIMSDGTSNLYFLTPDSLKLLKIVSVSDNNGPVPNINELEYIDGYIFANQWLTAYALKIDPVSGKVVGRLNLETLAKGKRSDEDPNWNGIAYDSATKKIYVTGKKWKAMYEIRLL